jgi:double-stranded uracil-DNA glycosylase
MHQPTIAIYEQRATQWERSRAPRDTDRIQAFAAVARRPGGEGPLVDLGCGPGWSIPHLGSGPTVALDAARAMLDLVPGHAPDALRVQADVAALPFRRGALGAAWGSKSYVHLPRTAVPLALADLHRCLPADAPAELILFAGDQEHGPVDDDDFPGRAFSLWLESHLRDVVVGAGFVIDSLQMETKAEGSHFRVRLTRARTLPDYVGAHMRLLAVGLNPSLYAADVGVGFARPGNRFWPAAIAAGLVTRDRDPLDALVAHGIGMTDLVKRATARADELAAAEYRSGLGRLERLVRWLEPATVCVLGLTGWRSAVDRRAVAGWQSQRLADVPVYVMPNPSGLNARTPLSELAAHLGAALGPAR